MTQIWIDIAPSVFYDSPPFSLLQLYITALLEYVCKLQITLTTSSCSSWNPMIHENTWNIGYDVEIDTEISMFIILDIVFIYEWTIINVIINDDNCAIIIYLMIATAYLVGRWKGRRKKGSLKWLMAKKSLTWKSILCGLSRNNLFKTER